jgi:hypothetical protein
LTQGAPQKQQEAIMRRLFLVISCLTVVGWAASSQAQLDPQSSILVTSVSYTYAQPENFDESLKGAGFSLVWEQVTWDRQMSIGFGGGYFASWFDRGDDSHSFSRIPFYAIFKGLFGPPKYTGYIGIGPGATIDRLEVTGQNGIEQRRTEAQFSLLVPVGVYLVPNPKVGFNFAASWAYSNSDFLKNNSYWAFTFGVLFLL